MNTSQRISRGFHRIGLLVAWIVFLVVVWGLWVSDDGLPGTIAFGKSGFQYAWFYAARPLGGLGFVLGLSVVVSLVAYGIVRVIGGVIGWVIGGFSKTDEDY